MSFPPALLNALTEAGLPGPDEFGLCAGRIAGYEHRSLTIEQMVKEERSYHQMYGGMVEYENERINELKRQMATGRTPARRPWATTPAQEKERMLVSAGTPSLESIEAACRSARSLGWTKDQVAQMLRDAGATWGGRKILGCPEENRKALVNALTSRPSIRRAA